MTKENYTQMSNRELLDKIQELGIYQGKLNAYLRRHYPELFNELVSRTHFLDDFYKEKLVPMPARLYCLEHDLKEQPKCQHPDCTNPVAWCHDGSGKFLLYCSAQCKDDAPQTKDKIKQTWRTKYGVDNVSKSPKIIEKIKQKMFEHHGVEHALQSPKFNKRIHRRISDIKYPGMTFDSKWELTVYEFLTQNHIKFEYQTTPMKYEYDGRTFVYHPDFKICNRIVEIKGDQFFRINKETGKEEMFCLYRDKDWSDEKYNWECGKEEAKHQCMLANGVLILRGNDIKNLSIELLRNKGIDV